MIEMEDVVLSPEEAVFRKQRAELSDLVEEEIRVPVLAIELVALDIREHAMSELDHLIVSRPLLFRAEKVPVIGDQLLALPLEPLMVPMQRLAGLHAADISGDRRKGHRQIVVPRAVIVIEAVADVDVEPRIAGGFELLEPLAPLRSRL